MNNYVSAVVVVVVAGSQNVVWERDLDGAHKTNKSVAVTTLHDQSNLVIIFCNIYFINICYIWVWDCTNACPWR